jgi:hypothetical protein
MPEVTVTPGSETSEHKMAKSAATIAKLMAVLGAIVTFGGSIAEMLGTESKTGIIAGAVVAIAGVLVTMFASLGYTKSRTIVKAAAVAKLAEVVTGPND